MKIYIVLLRTTFNIFAQFLYKVRVHKGIFVNGKK